MISKIQGGIRVQLPAKTIGNNKNKEQKNLKLTLRVSGPSRTAVKDISISWGNEFRDFYDEGYDIENSNNFDGAFHFSGVAVLIAFLLSLIMLTATVCVALYKRGYLCLREDKVVNEKESALNSLEEVSLSWCDR